MLQNDPYIELTLRNRLIAINKSLKKDISQSEKADIQQALSYSILNHDRYQTEFQRLYKELSDAVL